MGTNFAHQTFQTKLPWKRFCMTTIFKSICLSLLLLLIALPVCACFGPKLYVGTASGVEGELQFHLLSLYIQEKTGVESIRVAMSEGQTANNLLQEEKIDFGFSTVPNDDWPHLLAVGEQLYLLHGPRPVADLQFTTVPKALKRLQKVLKVEDWTLLQQQVAAGALPAKAVRQLYMQRGWI
jgi:hypothetical protein